VCALVRIDGALCIKGDIVVSKSDDRMSCFNDGHCAQRGGVLRPPPVNRQTRDFVPVVRQTIFLRIKDGRIHI
jgi:hypothetical protein